MNKKFLKHYMETEPEGTSKKYIFLVDNQDIAMNIVMSGYQALYLGQEDDGYYFSVNSFIEDMRSINQQDVLCVDVVLRSVRILILGKTSQVPLLR